MEESKELQKLYGFMQAFIYITCLLYTSLQDNEIITKTINNQKYLVQLDPETNELLKTKIKSISIPSNIKGVELDKQQKETLKSCLLYTSTLR